MFFDNLYGLLRVVIVGVLAYLALILWLRLAGKRTLSKWNAFDFVVTIAIGSTLATVLLSKDVALVEGVTAFAFLIGMQFVITWISVRHRGVERLIKAEPRLLLRKGRLLSDALRSERVTEAEIRAAVRRAGLTSLEEVDAVVLETDGSFSVIRHAGNPAGSAMADVPGYAADSD